MKTKQIKKFFQKYETPLLIAICLLILFFTISYFTKQAQQEEAKKACEECYARGSLDTRDRIFEIVLKEGGVVIENSGKQMMKLVLPQ